MLKKILFFFLPIICASSYAQTVRKYSNEFMNIGVDAAALGMANAVTANTNDVNSGYWTPAGLIGIEDKQISLMHASYFANIAQYDFAAYATAIDDESAWGISMIRFGVDDIFHTMIGRSETKFENQNWSFRSSQDTRRFRIALNYEFGKIKIDEREFVLSDEDEKNRLSH